MNRLRQIPCPTCKKKGDWHSTPYGPFCSQRCKLVDLSQWFNEEHRLSEPLRPGHFTDYEHLPPGEHLDQPEP
jgi:endogenous inhibitor of DNA gyrase (YacG/DUF329 family)